MLQMVGAVQRVQQRAVRVRLLVCLLRLDVMQVVLGVERMHQGALRIAPMLLPCFDVFQVSFRLVAQRVQRSGGKRRWR